MFEALKLFFKGALLDQSTEKIEARAKELNDRLLTLILSHKLGIPNPFLYHTVEILPYLCENLKGLERRILDRKSLISRITGEIGEP
ncbi:hypothetical protein [Thermovibrio sp.]